MSQPESFQDSVGSQDADSDADQASANQTGHPSGRQVASEGAPPSMRQQSDNDEPEMALEPDLPSDGRDAVGEAMIRNLPKRTELSDSTSSSDPSRQPT